MTTSKNNLIKNRWLNITNFIILFFLVVLFLRYFIISGGAGEYQIGDLLINYKSGFSRRGLLGTFFINLSNITGINLITLINVSNLFMYITVWLIILRNIEGKPWIFLIIAISPFGLLYNINTFASFGYKDIYILFVFILLIFTEENLNGNKKTVTLALITILGSAIHENFLIFSSSFFISYKLLKAHQNVSKISLHKIITTIGTYSFLVSILLITTYLIAKMNQNSLFSYHLKQQYQEILQTYHWSQQQIRTAQYALDWLVSDLNTGISETSRNYKINKVLFTFIIHLSILVINILLLIRFGIPSFKSHKIHIYVIILIPLIISLTTIFYIAIDWGRWLHLIFMHFVIILSFTIKKNNNKYNYVPSKKAIITALTYLVMSLFLCVPVYYTIGDPNPNLPSSLFIKILKSIIN
jgi:hypothetical protein